MNVAVIIPARMVAGAMIFTMVFDASVLHNTKDPPVNKVDIM